MASLSAALSYYPYLLKAASLGVGSLLLYSGVAGTYIDPVGWVIGLGILKPTKETITFYPSATGRNFSAGLFIWIMTLMGESKTVGIFLMCWSQVGAVDIKVLNDHPQGEQQGKHLKNIVIVFTFGLLLYIF